MLHITGISDDSNRLYLSDGTERSIIHVFNIDAISRTLDFRNDDIRRSFSPDTLFCNRIINIRTKDDGDTPLEFILKSLGVDESNFCVRSDISDYSILSFMHYNYYKISRDIIDLYNYIQREEVSLFGTAELHMFFMSYYYERIKYKRDISIRYRFLDVTLTGISQEGENLYAFSFSDEDEARYVYSYYKNLYFGDEITYTSIIPACMNIKGYEAFKVKGNTVYLTREDNMSVANIIKRSLLVRKDGKEWQ